MRDIKVFISSTFNDLESERNKIMLAFREAERYAIENYVNIKTIDFRWGLPDGAHVMKSCLESINISKPYFLCILGDNYGSQPEWEDYEKEKGYLSEYNQFIEENVFKSNPEDNLSYTAMEVYFALSQEFGRDNIRFLHLSYKNCADSRQLKLIEFISKKGYSIGECNTPEELVKEVSQFLTTIIDNNSIIVDDDDEEDNKAQKYLFGGFNGDNTQHKQLSLYRKSQEYMLNSISLESFSREQEKLLDDFVYGSTNICCIEGEDGVGKSTMVARWLNSRIENKVPDEIIIYHFYQEGYIDDIFEHLYLELAEINHHTLEKYYAELFSTNEQFPKSLLIFEEAIKQLETDKRILIVLDGLEHNVDGFPGFFDMFSRNCKNIKLVLTTGNVPIDSSDVTILHLPSLKGSEANKMVSDYLVLHHKTKVVSNTVAEDLCVNPILHNPKLLSSVLYDIRAFANHNNIKDRVAKYMEAKDSMDIYGVIINNWKEVVPTIKENGILAWLAYSHYGLAEEDIKIISGYTDSKEYQWHQLFSFIEAYIEWNGDRIQFGNQWLKDAVVKDNAENENNIKNLMIQYFQDGSISIEKQFDELPLLLKELGRYDELLTYILDLSIFQYANGKNSKRDVLVDLWSNFELSDFSKYLDSSHNGIKQKDYVNVLFELSDFVYFHGIEMFPDEERFDIESLHSLICERILLEMDEDAEREMEPSQVANVYRTVAVAYMDSFRYEEAKTLLSKGVALLSPIVIEECETYDTTVIMHKTPELLANVDKTTVSLMESFTRTSLLKVLNPYIDLLGEMLNTNLGLEDALKYYKEIMDWIDKLDQMKERNRDTMLLRSHIDYAYGMNLYNAEEYLDAFEKFNNAFNLKFDYLLKEESFHRKDSYQEYRLMETYKCIESCQIMEGNAILYNNQKRYVQAVEKYGEEYLDIMHYCSCLYNYAASFYNQTVDKDDKKVADLLQNALGYYDKVISKTKSNQLNSLFIRASFYKMMCLARLDKDEEIPVIRDEIFSREKVLKEHERKDAQVSWILEICHSIQEE